MSNFTVSIIKPNHKPIITIETENIPIKFKHFDKKKYCKMCLNESVPYFVK